MRIGVVSDTHGHMEFTRAAVRLLEQHEVELVLHCGDIGSAAVIPLFDRWPTHFVFGNVDYDRGTLRAAIEAAGQTCHDRFGQLELAGKKIAFLHSDDGQLFRQTIASGEWDLVCYGHTHQAEQHLAAQTLVLNPGALYRANPRSFAVVELPELEVTSVPVSESSL
jgi:hypothetical protein